MRTSVKKTEEYFSEKEVVYENKTVNLQDDNLHYIKTGQDSKQTLVFVHGSPGSWDAWKAYLTDSILLQNFRMVAVDRPGFGHSDFRSSLALEPQADLLNSLVKKIDNGQPITLIGHSYGGPLIVKMGLKQPTLYENLMILAGALDPAAEKPEKWRKPLTWVPLKYLVPGALKPSNDELWMLKDDLMAMKPELASLSQNVMIIHGAADKLVPYQNVDFMQNEFTNVNSIETISLENERHFIVWDREKLIKKTLLEWLLKD
ncbi:alpha/beta fold hydrolase [Croceitalea rosinachiae]|uniref:Alpha/beta hydrolase n=1 Tax=Croceitalea rosinachiae TaxID=3075596 RepID=A0ABU3ABW0_9FLAO|nr:alpha/beta hydrolase [Croceitalea sp. F388]MDT0607671.1 alpha/beta hydrolase [Croceitalea sp. F388]